MTEVIMVVLIIVAIGGAFLLVKKGVLTKCESEKMETSQPTKHPTISKKDAQDFMRMVELLDEIYIK